MHIYYLEVVISLADRALVIGNVLSRAFPFCLADDVIVPTLSSLVFEGLPVERHRVEQPVCKGGKLFQAERLIFVLVMKFKFLEHAAYDRVEYLHVGCIGI